VSTLEREVVPFWAPSTIEVGDRVIGMVVEKRIGTSKFGDFTVLVVDGDDGETYHVPCWSAALRALGSQARVADVIDLAYAGKKPTKNGEHEFHDFTIELNGEEL
jgi:hypothetical protein